MIRHLTHECSNSTKAPTGKVPTGSPEPNSTKVPTGSESSEPSAEHVAEPTQESRTESSITAESQLNARSRSRCASFHQIIIEKLDLGLDSQRIVQDLVTEHGFQDKYWSQFSPVVGIGQEYFCGITSMQGLIDWGAWRDSRD